MRKIILYIACSLDGYIARSDGSVDWLFTDQDYGYTGFLGSVDTVVMGRKTYDQVLTFGPYPYSGKTGYVVSRSPGTRMSSSSVQILPGSCAVLGRGMAGTSGSWGARN